MHGKSWKQKIYETIEDWVNKSVAFVSSNSKFYSEIKNQIRGRSWKQKIYYILEFSDDANPLSYLDDFIITGLIIISALGFMFETEPDSDNFAALLLGIEIVATLVFTIEYGLRLWVCNLNRQYRHPVTGRIKYALKPLLIIDFCALIPLYLIIIFPFSFVINLCHILRFFRLFKISRYSDSVRTIARVMLAKREELFATFIAVIFVLVFVSSLMYFVETKSQPEQFRSIPATMWWGVITLTTVGYGDVYPTTAIGRVLSSCLALFGIGIIALPAGIIASGFSEEIGKRRQKKVERKIQEVEREIKEVDEDVNEVKEKIAINQTIVSISWEKLSEEEKEAIARHLQESSDLMKLCLDTVKEKYGDIFHKEEIIRDLAIFLYQESIRKNNDKSIDR